jgi:transcriptional regulator with XRE-family HTH domain
MGKTPRPKPARLAEKLLQIRLALDLSQNGMIKRLGLSDELFQSGISGYELGTREPPLPILLKYARAVGVCVEILIDDELKLPERLAVGVKHDPYNRSVPKDKKHSHR